MESKDMLKGLKIIKTSGEFSRVSVNFEAFTALRGVKPAIPFTSLRDAAGDPVRVFDIEGTKLYSCFKRGVDGAQSTTTFVMRTADATKHGAVGTDAVSFSATELAAA